MRNPIKSLGSIWVFRLSVLLFTVEATILAVTSRFPMPFDEGYHFGLIQFFSNRLSPIVTHQSTGTYIYGAIVQNSSLLYHYLMSFPYRFIWLFTHNMLIELAALRLINVAMIVASLFIARKLLNRLKVPDSAANMTILFFALTPVITGLAAQISYDNLLILMVTIIFYQTTLLIEAFNKRIFDTKRLLIVFILCLFTSLMKYAFLPIFLALALVIAWRVSRYCKEVSRPGVSIRKDFSRLSLPVKTSLVLGLLVGGLLCLRIYGVDIVRYHTPVPQCNQVLSVNACKQYYSWDDDYNYRNYYLSHPSMPVMGIGNYTRYWFGRCLLIIYGPTTPLKGPKVTPELILFSQAICLIFVIGAIGLINYRAEIRRKHGMLVTLVLIGGVYIVCVWARNYHDNVYLGTPVAINGRYIAPVLLPLYALFVLGFYYQAKAWTKSWPVRAKQAVVAMALAFLIISGGFVQYITYVSPSYGWIGDSRCPAGSHPLPFTCLWQ